MIIVLHDGLAIFCRGYGTCSLVCGQTGGFKDHFSCRIEIDVRIWRSTFLFRRCETWLKRRIGERLRILTGFKCIRFGLDRQHLENSNLFVVGVKPV